MEGFEEGTAKNSKLMGIIDRLKNFPNRFCSRSVFIKAEVLLLFFVFLYAGVMCYLSLVKYYTFRATAWDLGVFSQSTYTTLNFHTFFYNNLELGSHFHVHFSPVLILCLPFYSILQSPTTLLVLQAIVVASSGIPLYFLAKKDIGSSKLSIAFTAVYFLYPALHGANLYDFHAEAFVPLFGFSSLYFYKNEKWSKYFIFLILLLMIKEDMSLIAMSIGFYGLFSNIKPLLRRRINKNIIVSILTIIIGIVWLFLAFFMVSYFVRLDGYESLWDYGYSHHTANVYGELEGSGGPLGVLSYIISNPVESFTRLYYLPSEKLVFFATLFLPLCMFAFLDIPSILLFLPTLLEFVLASNPHYFAIKFHYAFQLVPTIFVATIHGIKKISSEYNQRPIKNRVITRVLFIMVVATLITLLFTTPMILQDVPLTVNEKDEARLRLISLIPLSTNPSILTQNDYFPHVSNSRYSYAYWNTTRVDYILIDICSQWYYYQAVPDEYVAKYGEPNVSFDALVKKYIESGEFGLSAQADSLMLYKRGYEGNLSVYYPYTRFIDCQKLYFFNATIIDDPTSISQKALLHKTGNGTDETFWYGPYLEMPPGEYEVRFKLKITNSTDKYILSLDVVKDGDKETLANGVLTGNNFSKVNTWQEFTLSFELDKPTFLVEFRGMFVSNVTDVYLDSIVVNQTAPFVNKFLNN